MNKLFAALIAAAFATGAFANTAAPAAKKEEAKPAAAAPAMKKEEAKPAAAAASAGKKAEAKKDEKKDAKK